MTSEEAFDACEATVRRFDPDRYFATLFAPADKRPLLLTLYAFNHELAHAVEAAREPMMAEIRLHWWREAVDGARENKPRAHPVAVALAAVFARAPVPAQPFVDIIDARSTETLPEPFADLAALEIHAGATSGALMRIAARLLDAQADVEEMAREAGVAYGLAGILRSIPFQAACGKLFVPADLLAAEGLSLADAFSGHDAAALKRAIAPVVEAAKAHLALARQLPIPATALAAFLPASLVPSYLLRIGRPPDPLRARLEISPFIRQLVLLRAALSGAI